MSLPAQTVVELAGYTYDSQDQAQADAVAFADAAIQAYTGAVIYDAGGSPAAYTHRARLGGASFHVPIPRDAQDATVVYPVLPTGATVVLNNGAIEAYVDYGNGPEAYKFPAGIVEVTGNRGWLVDGTILRAAALLVAYYLSLPDPERSAWSSQTQGDFSGVGPRLGGLPVPEAAALLARYVARGVGVAVT